MISELVTPRTVNIYPGMSYCPPNINVLLSHKLKLKSTSKYIFGKYS